MKVSLFVIGKNCKCNKFGGQGQVRNIFEFSMKFYSRQTLLPQAYLLILDFIKGNIKCIYRRQATKQRRDWGKRKGREHDSSWGI